MSICLELELFRALGWRPLPSWSPVCVEQGPRSIPGLGSQTPGIRTLRSIRIIPVVPKRNHMNPYIRGRRWEVLDTEEKEA